MNKVIASLVLIGVVIVTGLLTTTTQTDIFQNTGAGISKNVKDVTSQPMKVEFITPKGMPITFKYDPDTNTYVGYIKVTVQSDVADVSNLTNSPLSVVNIPGAKTEIANKTSDNEYVVKIIIPASESSKIENNGVILQSSDGRMGYYNVQVIEPDSHSSSPETTGGEGEKISSTLYFDSLDTDSTLVPADYYDIETYVVGNPIGSSSFYEDFYVVPEVSGSPQLVGTLSGGNLLALAGGRVIDVTTKGAKHKPLSSTDLVLGVFGTTSFVDARFLLSNGIIHSSLSGGAPIDYKSKIRQFYGAFGPLELVFIGNYLYSVKWPSERADGVQRITYSYGTMEGYAYIPNHVWFEHLSVYPRGTSKKPYFWATYFYDLNNLEWYTNETLVENLTPSLENELTSRILLYLLIYSSSLSSRSGEFATIYDTYKDNVTEIINAQNFTKLYDLAFIQALDKLYVIKNGTIVNETTPDKINDFIGMIQPGYKIIFVGIGVNTHSSSSSSGSHSGRISLRLGGSLIIGGGGSGGGSSSHGGSSSSSSLSLTLPFNNNTYVFDYCNIKELKAKNGIISNSFIYTRVSSINTFNAGSIESSIIIGEFGTISATKITNSVVATKSKLTVSDSIVNSTIAGQRRVEVGNIIDSAVTVQGIVFANQIEHSAVKFGYKYEPYGGIVHFNLVRNSYLEIKAVTPTPMTPRISISKLENSLVYIYRKGGVYATGYSFSFPSISVSFGGINSSTIYLVLPDWEDRISIGLSGKVFNASIISLANLRDKPLSASVTLSNAIVNNSIIAVQRIAIKKRAEIYNSKVYARSVGFLYVMDYSTYKKYPPEYLIIENSYVNMPYSSDLYYIPKKIILRNVTGFTTIAGGNTTIENSNIIANVVIKDNVEKMNSIRIVNSTIYVKGTTFANGNTFTVVNSTIYGLKLTNNYYWVKFNSENSKLLGVSISSSKPGSDATLNSTELYFSTVGTLGGTLIVENSKLYSSTLNASTVVLNSVSQYNSTIYNADTSGVTPIAEPSPFNVTFGLSEYNGAFIFSEVNNYTYNLHDHTVKTSEIAEQYIVRISKDSITSEQNSADVKMTLYQPPFVLKYGYYITKQVYVDTTGEPIFKQFLTLGNLNFNEEPSTPANVYVVGIGYGVKYPSSIR